MPQLRKDPVTNRWVIVNVEKPMLKFAVEPPAKSTTKICPFCPGNEAMTTAEIMVLGRKDGSRNISNWLVRVISNKFPALRIEDAAQKLAVGMYDKIGGFGAHEVIVENPDHRKEMADLPVEHVELILRAYRERCQDLRKDLRFQYVLIFKNFGSAAGASLEHPHSQLIALPIVPSRVLSELKGCGKYFEYKDRCVICDMLSQETLDRRLGILQDEGFAAVAPFASRFPFETWVLPTAHQANFDQLTDAELRNLARVLKATLQRLKGALNNPAYNMMIHTLPMNGKDGESYHWHIEIIPHLTQVAGFELGTGFYVNPTPPELAAEILRKQAEG
ncbi:MAG: galactose-1-phosphate uridylyltransferase [Candidatus Omnitrophota bacterium]